MNKLTVARPYAQALFSLAKEHDQVATWQQALTLLGAVVHEPKVQAFIEDPKVLDAELIKFLLSFLTELNSDAKFSEQASNFLNLLAEFKKLALVPEIFEAFELLRLEWEKTVDVKVFSAFELSSEQCQLISKGLEKRLQQQVTIQTVLAPELIGGVRIQAGDLVIDGSVKNKLHRLQETLLT